MLISKGTAQLIDYINQVISIALISTDSPDHKAAHYRHCRLHPFYFLCIGAVHIKPIFRGWNIEMEIWASNSPYFWLKLRAKKVTESMPQKYYFRQLAWIGIPSLQSNLMVSAFKFSSNATVLASPLVLAVKECGFKYHIHCSWGNYSTENYDHLEIVFTSKSSRKSGSD